MIDINWPERIRALRKEFNMSQKDIADMLGMSVRGVQDWENPYIRGAKEIHPRLSQLVKLGEIFHMSLNELIGIEVPEPADMGPFNLFLMGTKWYYWEIRHAVGRRLQGPFDTQEAAAEDLVDRSKGRGRPKQPDPEVTNPYPGVCWHRVSHRWIVQRYYKGQRHYIGVFYEVADAVAAVKKWESTHADAKHTNYVRPGRWQDNVGPGPGQRGPQNRDVGKRLQGDERPVHPWRKAVFGRGTGILPRSNDQQEASGVSDVQETVPRDELPGEGE